MKILVCVSCVPDTTSKVLFTEDNKFNKENIQFIIGPYEDYALSAPIANPFLNKGSFSDRPTFSRLITISLFFFF